MITSTQDPCTADTCVWRADQSKSNQIEPDQFERFKRDGKKWFVRLAAVIEQSLFAFLNKQILYSKLIRLRSQRLSLADCCNRGNLVKLIDYFWLMQADVSVC